MDHAARQPRIHAIDALRGFFLLNIFVNHLTLGSLQVLSPSRYGFSDSAEAFVLLAGISCFIAYGPRGDEGVFPGRAARMWSRAGTLFAFYLALAAATVAVLFVGAAFVESAGQASSPPALIAEHGLATYAWHALTMQQAAGFSAVLRLYVVLMLLAPAYVWLAAKRFWYPLVPAAAIWVLAGHFGWVERQSLSGGALALTILPWNLVFAAGIAFGAAIRQGAVFRAPRALTVLAAAIVLAGPLCVILSPHWPDLAAWIAGRNEHFWTGASKPLQSPLRVAHLLAVAYLLIAWRAAPVIRLVHEAGPESPLCRLGRRSLQVFTCGAVLATIGDTLLGGLFEYGLVARHSASALLIEVTVTALAFLAMLRVADARAAKPTAPAPALATRSSGRLGA